MPIISVIVPVYNTEKYLCRCVDSILAQTFTDFELILVDDGSPDHCGAICDEYASRDERVHVIHQENQGQAAARNHALDWMFANSDSQYISFVDSDDWVHPKYLELLWNGRNNHDAEISQCRHFPTDGETPDDNLEEKNICVTPKEEYIDYYSPYVWGKLFTRRIWQTLRFPEGQIYEDLAIWYKILFSQEKIVIVDSILYYYFQNSEGTMRSAWHPGMLARMDAWDAQVAFFDELGDEELLQCAVIHHCDIALSEYAAIGSSSRLTEIEKKEYQANISKRIRRVLIHYKQLIRATPYYSWCFNLAFPKTSYLYWTFQGIRNKIHTVFHMK